VSTQGTAPATTGPPGPPAPRTAESFGYFGRIGAQLSTIVTIASGVAYVIGVLVTDSYWRRLGTSPAAVGVQTADRIAISGVIVIGAAATAFVAVSILDRRASGGPAARLRWLLSPWASVGALAIVAVLLSGGWRLVTFWTIGTMVATALVGLLAGRFPGYEGRTNLVFVAAVSLLVSSVAAELDLRLAGLTLAETTDAHDIERPMLTRLGPSIRGAVAEAGDEAGPVAEQLDGRCVWLLGDSADDDVVRDPAIGMTFTLPAGELSFAQLKNRTRCPP
jgi:hypothetical protein